MKTISDFFKDLNHEQELLNFTYGSKQTFQHSLKFEKVYLHNIKEIRELFRNIVENAFIEFNPSSDNCFRKLMKSSGQYSEKEPKIHESCKISDDDILETDSGPPCLDSIAGQCTDFQSCSNKTTGFCTNSVASCSDAMCSHLNVICTNSSGCINSQSCTNSGSCVDEKCDDQGCVNGSGLSTPIATCSDNGVSGNPCTDTSTCTNISGCSDDEYCNDDGCFNSSCINSNGCIDTDCINEKECSDQTPCGDSNNSCSDLTIC